MRKVSIIVFYDNSNRILLQDRSSISKMGEEWGYFGGGIENLETKEAALVREIKEELDYDLEEYNYLGEFESIVNGNLIIRHLFISPLKVSLDNLNVQEGKCFH